MTTTITTDLSPVPTRQSPSTFSERMDTWIGKITDWTDEANDVAEEVNENAVTAAAGAAAVDAEKWVSGTTYAEGDVVWSPTDYGVYRRKTNGAGTTDPRSDGTNWAIIPGVMDVITTTLTGTTPEIVAGLNTWTLAGASTPTSGLLAGQSALLMVDDGSASTITWPSVTWKTNYGVAPTLETTGYTVVCLWVVGATTYGARVGNN